MIAEPKYKYGQQEQVTVTKLTLHNMGKVLLFNLPS